MANEPDNQADEPKASSVKFTLSTGEDKNFSGRRSLKLGGGKLSETVPIKRAPTPAAHPDIQFDEAPTPTTPVSSIDRSSLKFNHSAPAPKTSKIILAVEGIAAVMAITFTILTFQDLIPYL